jgi:holo-[acyl-carrier protein] synthase
MMKAIGVDLIEIGRVDEALEAFGERFLQRIFTAGEQQYCRGHAPSLAARWAAKEAVAKAFGCGIGPVAFLEIEVINDEQQRPSILLHGAAQALSAELGWRQIHVSLSHARDVAIAMVMAE